MHLKHQVIEEPCEAKVSRTVLEPRQGGDSLSLGGGMLKNHKLASSVADMGFYEFKRQMEYKAQLYGSTVLIIDRWFPSTKLCNCCGNLQDMPLNLRLYECTKCNYSADRDFNAALNIEAEVKRLLEFITCSI